MGHSYLHELKILFPSEDLGVRNAIIEVLVVAILRSKSLRLPCEGILIFWGSLLWSICVFRVITPYESGD
jgi:hypothetical protein